MQPSPSRARRVLAFCLLPVFVSFASFAFGEPPEITVTSYGAAEKVSGSLHALDIGDTRVVIDCGLEYAEKQGDDSESAPDERPKQTAPPIDAGQIDAVFLTHAHLDHVGRVPLLVASGYTGPIYCTDATKQLLAVVMDSQIYFDREVARDWYWSAVSRAKAAEDKKSFTVHWMPDCPFGGKIYAKNKQTLQGSRLELEDHFAQTEHKDRFRCCRECQKRNVDAILRMVKTVKVGETGELAPGVTFQFLPAGHLPGSVSVLFEAHDGDRRCRLLFSGDLGSGLSPLRPSPPPAPAVDFVAVEATYGAEVRDPETKSGFARFRSVVGKAIADGHTVLIPAFSLDRTQTVLQQLHAAREEGLLAADAPVYCPSPTSRRYTEIYERNRANGWFPQPVADAKGLWSADSFLSRGPDSKTLADTPLVYVANNSLGTADWSKKLLKDLLPRDDVDILFIGYQGAESLGGQIQDGAKEVTVGDKAVPVRASVHSFGCFSGHGDSADIDAWLSDVPQNATVMLIHGDKDAVQDRAAQLKSQGRENVVIAKRGKAIRVAWPKVKTVHP